MVVGGPDERAASTIHHPSAESVCPQLQCLGGGVACSEQRRCRRRCAGTGVGGGSGGDALDARQVLTTCNGERRAGARPALRLRDVQMQGKPAHDGERDKESYRRGATRPCVRCSR